MIITMRPASITAAPGTATWASTFATATAVPGRRPVQAAACSVSPPARSPMAMSSRDMRVSTTSAKRGSSAAK